MSGALSLRKLTKRERIEKYGIPPEEFNDPLPDIAPLPRPSESLESIAENDVALLDQMIERNGLARVLKTLSDLCESRAPSEFDIGSTFADVAHGEVWNEYATAIEAVIAGMK